MLIELTVTPSQKKVIDTDKIISVSEVFEKLSTYGNLRKIGFSFYRIEFTNSSTLDVSNEHEYLEEQRNKLIELWNKHKIEIPKI